MSSILIVRSTHSRRSSTRLLRTRVRRCQGRCIRLLLLWRWSLLWLARLDLHTTLRTLQWLHHRSTHHLSPNMMLIWQSAHNPCRIIKRRSLSRIRSLITLCTRARPWVLLLSISIVLSREYQSISSRFTPNKTRIKGRGMTHIPTHLRSHHHSICITQLRHHRIRLQISLRSRRLHRHRCRLMSHTHRCAGLYGTRPLLLLRDAIRHTARLTVLRTRTTGSGRMMHRILLLHCVGTGREHLVLVVRRGFVAFRCMRRLVFPYRIRLITEISSSDYQWNFEKDLLLLTEKNYSSLFRGC